MRRRLCKLLLIGVGLTAIVVSTALAYTETYAGPKTWLQGWDQGGNYDGGGPLYWQVNAMGPKSDDGCYPSCSSRVVFIDTSSGWTYSYTDSKGVRS
jgi:hypothetical protein